MSKSSKPDKKPIEQYDHKGKERVNNPPVGLVTPETDRESGKKSYGYDPRTIIEACRSATRGVHLRLICLKDTSGFINAEVK